MIKNKFNYWSCVGTLFVDKQNLNSSIFLLNQIDGFEEPYLELIWYMTKNNQENNYTQITADLKHISNLPLTNDNLPVQLETPYHCINNNLYYKIIINQELKWKINRFTQKFQDRSKQNFYNKLIKTLEF